MPIDGRGDGGELRRIYRQAWPRRDGWRRIRLSRLSEARRQALRRMSVQLEGAVVIDLRVAACGCFAIVPLRDEYIALRDRCELN